MPWYPPITWTQRLVTVDDLNEQVRDNLLYALSGRVIGQMFRAGGQGTTSSAWGYVDSTNVKLTVTPQSSRVLVLGHMLMECANYSGHYGACRLYCSNGAAAGDGT